MLCLVQQLRPAGPEEVLTQTAHAHKTAVDGQGDRKKSAPGVTQANVREDLRSAAIIGDRLEEEEEVEGRRES